MENDQGIKKVGDEENSNSVQSYQSQEIPRKAKSCKGCLYYSSTRRSNSFHPLCAGFTRSLPQVPSHIVGESEMEASREGRSLADFRYACVGYSVYSERNDPSTIKGETPTELPVCVGLEILVDKTVDAADSAPAHVHNKEDSQRVPQRAHRPASSIGDEFLNRFSRNATVVAMGVAKNLHRVASHVKERVDDILYPYRRRPK